MKNKCLLLLILLFASNLTDCYSQKVIRLAQNGSVAQINYSTKIPFRYENKHIFIDVSVNGIEYNFLFDSGADFCVIDLNHIKNVDYKKVKMVKSSGSSFATQKTQLVELDKLRISDIDFNEIGAAIMDLSFINTDYPCASKPIAGIIGATLLRKAYWQIDYINREIIFSDNVSNLTFSKNTHGLEMVSKSWGSPLINVKINGIDKKFILDTGSSGKITAGNEFLQELDTVKYIEVSKEDKMKNPYTNYYIQTAIIEIGNVVFENHTISLENGVSFLIGNEFFENFIVTLDWKRNMIFLDSKTELVAKPLYDFEITLQPNFTSNKIQINRVYNKNLAKNNFKIGTEILKINDVDVSVFSKKELCDFWENEWSTIRLNDMICIETEKGKFELVKMNLL